MAIETIFSIVASVTAIIVNGYTIYTIRKHLGQLAKQGAEKIKDKVEKIF
jgi:hypothetical protein